MEGSRETCSGACADEAAELESEVEICSQNVLNPHTAPGSSIPAVQPCVSALDIHEQADNSSSGRSSPRSFRIDSALSSSEASPSVETHPRDTRPSSKNESDGDEVLANDPINAMKNAIKNCTRSLSGAQLFNLMQLIHKTMEQSESHFLRI